jgi:hypothetical protein
MLTHGHVKNGVVVLDEGVRLPEGLEVTVLAPGAEPALARPHSLLDIAPISLGAVLRPMTAGEDLLGEMLEGRS